MSNSAFGEGRRIVTCDGCGTPYAAVVEGDDVLLVGREGGECPNCSSDEFSKLTL